MSKTSAKGSQKMSPWRRLNSSQRLDSPCLKELMQLGTKGRRRLHLEPLPGPPVFSYTRWRTSSHGTIVAGVPLSEARNQIIEKCLFKTI